VARSKPPLIETWALGIGAAVEQFVIVPEMVPRADVVQIGYLKFPMRVRHAKFATVL